MCKQYCLVCVWLLGNALRSYYVITFENTTELNNIHRISVGWVGAWPLGNALGAFGLMGELVYHRPNCVTRLGWTQPAKYCYCTLYLKIHTSIANSFLVNAYEYLVVLTQKQHRWHVACRALGPKCILGGFPVRTWISSKGFHKMFPKLKKSVRIWTQHIQHEMPRCASSLQTKHQRHGGNPL